VDLSRDEIADSLRQFKTRRDNLLHEDVATFDHHLERFLEFCERDPLAQTVLGAVKGKGGDVDAWWAAATQHDPQTSFPSDADGELDLQYGLLRSAAQEPNHVFQLGIAHRQQKRDGWVDFFRTLVVRPFADEMSHRIGKAADLATPEARTVQAVPLARIPSPREVRIFLSHKSVDKPLVRRYYDSLRTLGFDPWLDEPNMPAGSNLERELLRGFEESCGAVFFITESFKDEKHLATEIDYAIHQKRRKEKTFAIVTLRYTSAAPVPGLLQPYVYRDVANDLEGFDVVIKALPIELGPVRWKRDVV
jgi:hypothetical protein